MTSHFTEKDRRSEYGHTRKRDHGLADLERNLIFEILGVCKCSMVEDQQVGQRGADKVDNQSKEPVTVGG